MMAARVGRLAVLAGLLATTAASGGRDKEQSDQLRGGMPAASRNGGGGRSKVATSAACCSWDSCSTCGQTSDFCMQSSTCSNECQGRWCASGPNGAPSNDPSTTRGEPVTRRTRPTRRPTAPTPKPPTGSTASGCCSWDGCTRCGETTAFCSQEAQCSNECKGQWCPGDGGTTNNDPPPVPVRQPSSPPPPPTPPTTTSGCCSWDGCTRCGETTAFCSQEAQCSNECKGQWCPGDGGTTNNDPPPVPVGQPSSPPPPPPPTPPTTTSGCCSWDGCTRCGETTAYCSQAGQCEADCGGQWCTSGGGGGGGTTNDPPPVPVGQPSSPPPPPSPLPPSGSGRLVSSICDSGAGGASAYAYACIDWSVGSAAMERAASAAGMGSTHIFGVGSYGSGSENMGKCYDVVIGGTSKRGLFQIINQGGDVMTNQLDVQMGNGGLGAFNGCVDPSGSGGQALYGATGAAWGARFGGVPNRRDCAALPSWPASGTPPAGERDLRQLCEAGFDLGLRLEGGGNPSIVSTTRVPCPASLVALTGLGRSDDANAREVNTAQGLLTRMMDCCKPSSAWPGNAQSTDPRFPAAHSCQADGYTRIPV